MQAAWKTNQIHRPRSMRMKDQVILVKFTGKCNVFWRQAGKATKCTPRKRDSAVWRGWKALSSLITQRYKPKGPRQSLTWPAQWEKGKNPVCMRHVICHRWHGRSKLLREKDLLTVSDLRQWRPTGVLQEPTIFRDYHIFAMATPTCIGRWGQEGPFVSPLPSSTPSQAQAYHWKQNIGKNSSAQTDCTNKQDSENQGDY